MKIKDGFNMRSVMGQNIVLAEGPNADTFNKMITLNSSAALLWQNLHGHPFDVADAAAVLTAYYGIDAATAHADAVGFIGLMSDNGLLNP